MSTTPAPRPRRSQRYRSARHACLRPRHARHLASRRSAVLAQAPDAWQGTLLVVFQPAEETAQGAQAMIDDGLLNGSRNRPSSWPARHAVTGRAHQLPAGATQAAADSLEVRLFGRGAHGSMPESSVDPASRYPSSVSQSPPFQCSRTARLYAPDPMKRFAFYGRVSTEDQQDPESSRNWQLARSRAGHRAARRRDRRRVLRHRPVPIAALEAPPRGRRASSTPSATPTAASTPSSIGEPQRAFYGNQFGLTFPVFVHYGVELWVPEVGGAVDPGSDAHDLVMSLYGGMSKGERNRIKTRVRSAMAAQAASRAASSAAARPTATCSPTPARTPTRPRPPIGQRLHRLEPDPVAAPVVQRIFAEFLAGHGLYAIAEGLTRDGDPVARPRTTAPATATAPAACAWSKCAVRAILTNPRYTGPRSGTSNARDEVAPRRRRRRLGHETKMRWNDAGRLDLVHQADHTSRSSTTSTFAQPRYSLRAPEHQTQPRGAPTAHAHLPAQRAGALRRVRTADAGPAGTTARPTTAASSPEYALANQRRSPAATSTSARKPSSSRPRRLARPAVRRRPPRPTRATARRRPAPTR